MPTIHPVQLGILLAEISHNMDIPGIQRWVVEILTEMALQMHLSYNVQTLAGLQEYVAATP
jgi:hypothetical protein